MVVLELLCRVCGSISASAVESTSAENGCVTTTVRETASPQPWRVKCSHKYSPASESTRAPSPHSGQQNGAPKRYARAAVRTRILRRSGSLALGIAMSLSTRTASRTSSG
eukprot:Amastigsp_a175039_14.p5 type:complete len:110 gc:universal Amastigsp_a175039_14:1220-891(-)